MAKESLRSRKEKEICKECQQVTVYKNNSRNSSEIRAYSPLQLSCNLTGKCHAVGYYSYTNR